eukprot:scaffold43323_cov103-Attheya_sp.AAC.3
MNSSKGPRRRLSFQSPSSSTAGVTSVTPASVFRDITNTSSPEKERLVRRNSDLELVVRTQEQSETVKQLQVQQLERENANLKKVTEELMQKKTDQAASFVESEWKREQLKSTFELRMDEMKEKCEKLSKANTDIQYQHTILMLELKSEFAKRIDSLEEELARNASKDAIALSSPLRYADFLNGAHFSKYTDVFFNLPDMNSVEKITEAINVKRDKGDPGICTCLQRYSYVTRKVREGNQEFIDGKKGLASSCENAKGWTYMQIEAVFQVSDTMVSDIVHQYSAYLEFFFKKTMPNPTKQEVLRRYPKSFIEKHGHGQIAMILDCCDQGMEDPRLRNLHSVLYSSYHAQTGANFGVGCTPFGVVPHTPGALKDTLPLCRIQTWLKRPRSLQNI